MKMPARPKLTFAVTAVAASVLVLVLVACSDADDRPSAASAWSSSSSTSASSSSGGGGPETAADGGASPDASSADAVVDGASNDGSTSGGPACADVAREGPEVGEVRIAQDPPAAAGGTIAAGKYFLTSWETFTGPDGTAGSTGTLRRTTLVVTASTFTFATRDVEEAEDQPVRVESFQTGGLAVDSVETCPLGGRTLTRNFTASSGELILFEPFGVFTRRLVFTKQ